MQEIKDVLTQAFMALADWVRPNKDQSPMLQVVMFVLKLPVLLLLLLLSPVLLVVLLLVSLIAL